MKQNKIKKAKSDYTLIVGHSVAQQWDTAVILNVRAQSDIFGSLDLVSWQGVINVQIRIDAGLIENVVRTFFLF